MWNGSFLSSWLVIKIDDDVNTIMKMDAVHKKRTKKRRRTVISPDEIEKLEESFEKEQKPDRITKLELAKQLSKPESFVNIWFQNRRAKERKMKTPLNSFPVCESKNGIRDHGDKYKTENTVIDTPPLFRRMIMMAAASEGGILSHDCPDVGKAITDTYKGIRLADGVLQYNKATGFDILDLD